MEGLNTYNTFLYHCCFKVEDAVVLALARHRRPNLARQSTLGMVFYCFVSFHSDFLWLQWWIRLHGLLELIYPLLTFCWCVIFWFQCFLNFYLNFLFIFLSFDIHRFNFRSLSGWVGVSLIYSMYTLVVTLCKIDLLIYKKNNNKKK